MKLIDIVNEEKEKDSRAFQILNKALEGGVYAWVDAAKARDKKFTEDWIAELKAKGKDPSRINFRDPDNVVDSGLSSRVTEIRSKIKSAISHLENVAFLHPQPELIENLKSDLEALKVFGTEKSRRKM
jgi:hypothetical protein